MLPTTWRGARSGSDASSSEDDGNDIAPSALSALRAARGGAADRSTVSSIRVPAAPVAAANHAAVEDGDPENKVYRPLLFQSKGYASSELFRDTYEMRTRMLERQAANAATSPSSALLLGSSGNGFGSRRHNKKHYHMAEPRIRLETLSSRAATTVLWITYLSFCLAFAMPYLRSQGFLGTVVNLPGGRCEDRIQPHEPCIFVDKKRGIARWSGLVSNVSRYAGSIELSLDISEVINSTSSLTFQGDDREENELQKLDAFWQNWRPGADDNDNGVNGTTTSLAIIDQSFALSYDVTLYGIDFDSTPYTKKEIVAEKNQSVWVECPSTACNKVTLLDISQDFQGGVRCMLLSVCD